MKKFYAILLIIAAFASADSKANTITLTTNNGDWQTNSTWNPARAPQVNDTIIIPAGMTVNIYNNVSISGYAYVQVFGTLQFNHSSKLDLGSTSKIFVHTGGKISSVGSSASDQVRIGATTVYKGNSGDLAGPVLLDSGGSHPVSEIPLPVRFVSFTLSRQQQNILIEWSTAQESNSSHFIVERSNNGTDWTAISTVKAAGESSTLLNYSSTDKNPQGTILYYRIKQVDLDGAYIFTAVRSIRPDNNNTDITVTTAASNKLLVHFSNQVKSSVVIRLVSMSGQVIAQQNVSNPSGQVVFSVANVNTGIYVVNVTDGKELKTAKQILL